MDSQGWVLAKLATLLSVILSWEATMAQVRSSRPLGPAGPRQSHLETLLPDAMSLQYSHCSPGKLLA